MNRLRIKVAGQSGSGLLSVGEILINSFKELGYNVVADREYPSLIKGGYSCFSINVSDKEIKGLSNKADIMLSIDKESMEAYFDTLEKGGILVHGYERLFGIKDLIEKAKKRDIKVVHQMVRSIAKEKGASILMTNVILTGIFWKTLGLDYNVLKKSVENKFKSKPELLEINLRCLKAGYDSVDKIISLEDFKIKLLKKKEKKIVINGNKALALGAVHAGCRFYIAYPMSPSSSILTYFSEMSEKTGVMVKQGEDEITVANMALGAMFMGTRALFATSGGGYDLMTETVSLAGMIENPLVGIIAQRPGPATGLPTWTLQADLNLAIYSSHGEFPKVVISISDPQDAFDLIQHAFNISEKYQIVVLVLTEKNICESEMTISPFKQGKISIERGLVKEEDLQNLKNIDRFRITKNGLSKRWIPGSTDKAYYFANGDEHDEDGSLTEDGEKCASMYEKRMRKMDLVSKALPEPEIYGVRKGADISFVGWGSSKNIMRDVIAIYKNKGIKVNYLHFSYLYPLKTKVLERFFNENSSVNLIEGNYQGQLGKMIEAEVKKKFAGKLLKYNGRPFFLEDLEKFINKRI